MGIFKGGALRIVQSALRYRPDHGTNLGQIYNWEKAVEGLSGAAVLYLIAATLLTCCLGGVSFFATLAIILDVLFCGAMIAIAVMTRQGAGSCSGYVRTPLGNGQANSGTGGFGNFGSGNNENVTYSVHLKTACRLNTVCFAVAIIGAFLFIITAAMQLLLIKNHKKEKRFGPGPDNNYTKGSGKKRGGMFGRKNKKNNLEHDAELGAAGTAVGTTGLAAHHHNDLRPSHDTGYTGSTVAASGNATYDKVEGHHAPHGSHGGYYTQPTGTGASPYGLTQPTYTTGTATNY
ncbi:hypothetical protein LTR86_007469 [Recurvomyces mirabilis]|nr:hypothetical protein LTR86_007469 [Recurvomyces mirabilis]